MNGFLLLIRENRSLIVSGKYQWAMRDANARPLVQELDVFA
jgi:hypothetical protein